MPTATKEGTFSASSDPCVLFPLAASVPDSGVYPKNRVWGSKPENVHCSSATARLTIELRWGCEKSSEKTAVGSGVSFKYDPFGRRIYKSSSSGTSIYAYDEYNLVETINASGSVVARYTQTQNIDEPLAMLSGTTTDYYQADALGTVTSLTDTTGALAQTYTFDSFGNIIATSGSLVNSFRYTAREFDSETNLYYYRARYYDSSTGRFLSEDPLRFFSDINFYRYVFNSPLNFMDPLGFDCTCTYHQGTGAIRCVDNQTGKVVAEGTGYAGNGPGLNNPDMQGTEDTGPLPTGSYSIGAPTKRKGPVTLPLTPLPGTDLHGRPGGFLIHGDNKQNNHSASHGCIIQSRNVREAISSCGGGTVNVEK